MGGGSCDGGRGAGTSLLRHAYITEMVDFNKMSVHERAKIAALMGHNVDTQGLVYKWTRPPPRRRGPQKKE